jgi:hypothetical protein
VVGNREESIYALRALSHSAIFAFFDTPFCLHGSHPRDAAVT